MAWEVEYTDDFESWWNGLEEREQVKIAAAVRVLEENGPDLPFPLSSSISASAYRLRELRVQVHGRPYRILYIFDPRRVAILLLGGDKTGDDRWYQVNVPKAERLYEQHLEDLRREGGRKERQEDG